MKHFEVEVALWEQQTERLRAELWEVQLKNYPDSVEITLADALDMTYKSPANLEKDLREWDYLYGKLYSGEYLVAARQEKIMRSIHNHQISIARSIIIAMQRPYGMFYKCCKQENGAYRWMGYRYGVEDSAYYSGFETYGGII